MARDQADRRAGATFSELASLAAKDTLLTIAGGMIGIMLVGGFETRGDFWLFLFVCLLIAFPATFVLEYFWPRRRT
jgi:phosphotransferase system  glucose/maltose/N-acetylglucosamine-specific IIC component